MYVCMRTNELAELFSCLPKGRLLHLRDVFTRLVGTVGIHRRNRPESFLRIVRLRSFDDNNFVRYV